MSEKFEEIVLKKLDKLDQLDETVQNVVLKKLDNLENEVESTKQGLQSLNEKFGKLELEVKDMAEVVVYLNNNFTKFDYDFNKKIDTLFDSYTSCKEKEEVHAQNIVSLNTKTFNHDIRISNLENQVLEV